MKRSAAATLTLALIAGFLILLTPVPAMAFDKDCGDFSNQRQAQIYYIKKGGPRVDPDDLDRDNDGIACDSNPCPCYYGSHLPNTPPARRTVHTHVHLAASSWRRIAGEPVTWTVSVDPNRVRSVKLQRSSGGTWTTVERSAPIPSLSVSHQNRHSGRDRSLAPRDEPSQVP